MNNQKYMKIGSRIFQNILNNYDKAKSKNKIDLTTQMPIVGSGYELYSRKIERYRDMNIGLYKFLTENKDKITPEDWIKIKGVIYWHQENALQTQSLAQSQGIYNSMMPYDFFIYITESEKNLSVNNMASRDKTVSKKNSSKNSSKKGKRKGVGRPKGSKNKPKNKIQVKAKKRGRPKGSKNKPKSTAKKINTKKNNTKKKVDLRKTATAEKKQWRKNTIIKITKSKQAARRKHGKIDCPPGTIMREGYVRAAFVRKNGTKVAKKIVAPSCIKKRGLPTKFKPPKGKAGIGPLKKGELSKHGYTEVKKLGVRKRRGALGKAIDDYGAPMVLKKLGAIKTLLKRTSPDYSKIYMDNMKWMRKKYDNQFKSSWKNSAVYKK